MTNHFKIKKYESFKYNLPVYQSTKWNLLFIVSSSGYKSIVNKFAWEFLIPSTPNISLFL